ncbi:hypothetical protein ACIBF5_31175 [Micromonospora sp. NPDC050417]|uniref:hypothetical protein n=1 Tax=Micromonospora sp. NPDC050417 TaxID=3364280 RepID=UPI00379B66FB
MTAPHPTSANIARDSASVGVQAGVVHGDLIYQVAPDASPAERYRKGVLHLDGGMPAKARKLIHEAIIEGHVSSEVHFHWLLAILSGRRLRQLSEADLAMLGSARQLNPAQVNDRWAEGLRMIGRLLDSLGTPDSDLDTVMKEFDELGPVQRDKITRHLELFLSGPIEDRVWDRAHDQARQDRVSNDRRDRAWMFFEPEPAAPRVRQPTPPMITMVHQIRAVAATTVLAVAVGYLGWLILHGGTASAIFTYLLSITGGLVCAITGLEWRSRTARIRAKDREYWVPRQPASQAPGDGFANAVDRKFAYYFAKYTPRGVDQQLWLSETAGIRRSLRDEIVDGYRESRIPAPRIHWLIRYRVSDVAVRWRNGTLVNYRSQFRVSVATKVSFLVGSVALVLAGVSTIGSAVQARPLGGLVATILALASARIATTAWLHLVLEHRRFAAEQAESQQRLAESWDALRRWQKKLARKPEDTEMAAWLDFDRRALVDEAMRHYKLAPSEVIAHACLEAPAASSKKARVKKGPWRWSKYRLLVFLLTTDGVRQVTADLDFEAVSFHNRQRANYRFDAIASVRVSEADNDQQTFELTLVNGPPISVPVNEPRTEQLEQGESSRDLSEATLDASGLRNTLHVLEGIAAEGKEWIRHEDQRGGHRMDVLTSAVRNLLR